VYFIEETKSSSTVKVNLCKPLSRLRACFFIANEANQTNKTNETNKHFGMRCFVRLVRSHVAAADGRYVNAREHVADGKESRSHG
jgi:hypothetical protein